VRISFVDLKAQYLTIKHEIDETIADVISDTAFINGKYVLKFEESFAQFCEAKHCVCVGNGTDAILLALMASGIGPGDEVIVPANTFVATSEAVTMAGAKVIFVDCDPETYNIDVNGIESVISPKTRAIIPVHLYGQPADMRSIRHIADNHGLKIIQDCAQAHGAEIDGKPLGSFGDVLCYSFYPGKNLGAYGDAGAIVTDDKELATRARMLANHGRISKYDHEFEGINSRMDGIQGAILYVKLKNLSEWTKGRRENARSYNRLLQGVKDIVTPYVSPIVKHVYHLFVLRAKRRDQLQEYLKTNGIATGIHYPVALPNLRAYRYLGHKPSDFPVASQCQEQILSLPMYPELSEEMIEYISEKVMEFYEL
jgi:dTDP-4-amino-4,6-dideoxygalactose transaminase